MYVVQRGKRFTGYYRRGGRRLSAGSWATYSQAQSSALRAEILGLEAPSRANLTLSQYIAEWLPTADLMPITRKGYGSVLDTHVLPRLGDTRVVGVTRMVIRRLLNDLKNEGVGNATIGQVKASLGSAFKRLVDTEEVPVNPTHGIRIHIQRGDFNTVLEPEDFKKILMYLQTPSAKLLAQYLVATGCRFGEATEARVKDINFKNGEVYVQRRVSDLGAKYNAGRRFLVVEATKSGHKRSLVMSKALLHEIEAYVLLNHLKKGDLLFPKALVVPPSKIESSRVKQKSTRPFEIGGKKFQHGTLYSYTHGGCRCQACKQAIRKNRESKAKHKQESDIGNSSHLARDVWRTTWNKAIAKSGIGWSPRTHDLRHANATQLLKSGVDVHEVKERLGHQSIKTTERYLHRLRNNQSEAGETVNDFLE